jgi:hypothetical protein
MQIAMNHAGGSNSNESTERLNTLMLYVSRLLTLSTASAQLVLEGNFQFFLKSIYAYIIAFIRTSMHINMTHLVQRKSFVSH